jgi:hypothetical protein
LERSGLSRPWSLNDVELISSAYAIEEARRNLAVDRPEAVKRFTHLVEALWTTDAPQPLKVPKNLRLAPKEQPILLATIQGKADYLLTGDAKHFDHLYEKRIESA